MRAIINIYNHLKEKIGQEDEVSATLKEWGVNDYLVDSIFSVLREKITHPRLFGHIRKLLTAENQYEIAFGIAIAINWDVVFSRGETKCMETILGEGENTYWWWTVGVYLFDELRKQFESKITDAKPLYLLKEWAATTEGYSASGEKISLAGLQRYNLLVFNEPYFTLGKNPTGQSHILAREEASRLIRKVDIFAQVRKQAQPEA